MKTLILIMIFAISQSIFAQKDLKTGLKNICTDPELSSFPVKVNNDKVIPLYVHAKKRIDFLVGKSLRAYDHNFAKIYCYLSFKNFPNATFKDIEIEIMDQSLIALFGLDVSKINKDEKSGRIKVPYSELAQNEKKIASFLYYSNQEHRKYALSFIEKIKLYQRIINGEDWTYALMNVKNIAETLNDSNNFIFNTASISEIKWYPVKKLKNVALDEDKGLYQSILQELKDSKTYYIIQNGERYLLGLIYTKGHFYQWSILMLFFTLILFWGFFDKKLWVIFYCMSLFMQMLGLILKIFGDQNGFFYMDDRVVFVLTELLIFMFIFLDYNQYKKMFAYAIFGNLFFLIFLNIFNLYEITHHSTYFATQKMSMYLFFIMSSSVSYVICWVMANISLADRVDNRGGLINIIDRFLIKKFLGLGALLFVLSILGMFMQEMTFYGSLLHYFQNHFWHSFYFIVSIIIIIFRDKKDLSFVVYISVFIMSIILIIQNLIKIGQYYLGPQQYITQGLLISILVIQFFIIFVFIKKEKSFKDNLCQKISNE